MSVDTSNPFAARAHARNMGETLAKTTYVLPPSAGLIWDETIVGGGGASRSVVRGTQLTLTDTAGDACASILIFNSEGPAERLNVADTIKVQWNAYPGPGTLLLSDMGRAMACILADDAQTHDMFCGASNATQHQVKYGASGCYGPYPSARDRFLVAAAKHGLEKKDVHPCLTLFKGVRIHDDGMITPELGPFPPGRSITLRAEMNLIFVIANCPHPLDTRSYTVTPLQVFAHSGSPTSADDQIRSSTPERLRAYLNTDDYFRR